MQGNFLKHNMTFMFDNGLVDAIAPKKVNRSLTRDTARSSISWSAMLEITSSSEAA